jgi:hypothetical protein
MRITIVALSLMLGACASGTEGRIVSVRFALEAEAEPDRPLGGFVTRTGWTVTLERAEIALAAAYGFAPEREPAAISRIMRALVPVARAHGGHDPLSGKRVRAEWLGPAVVDVLDERARDLGEVDAEAGAVASLAVDIAAPSAGRTAELAGRSVYVAGVAERAGEQVHFAGGIELAGEGLLRRIEITGLELTLDEGDTLRIGIRPSIWLGDAEFARLEPTGDDEPRPITPEDQVGRALFRGVRSPAALSIRVTREEMIDD